MREKDIGFGAPGEEPTTSTAPNLIADELLKLAQLKEPGVISDQEFTALKGKLIGDHMAPKSE